MCRASSRLGGQAAAVLNGKCWHRGRGACWPCRPQLINYCAAIALGMSKERGTANPCLEQDRALKKIKNKKHVEVLTPEPQSVALLGNRVVADALGHGGAS